LGIESGLNPRNRDSHIQSFPSKDPFDRKILYQNCLRGYSLLELPFVEILHYRTNYEFILEILFDSSSRVCCHRSVVSVVSPKLRERIRATCKKSSSQSVCIKHDCQQKQRTFSQQWKVAALTFEASFFRA